MTLSPRARALSQPLLLVGMLLAALNLRPALTSIAPLLQQLGQVLGLSATGLGVITTLPVLCLGLAAPFAPWLARRVGAERAITHTLLVLTLATAVRPFFGVLVFFICTAVAGAAIGILGVLLPALVKRSFAKQASVVTGAYTMVLSLGAALAAGMTEPLRLLLHGHWQWALAAWLLPSALSWGFWCFLLQRLPAAAEAERRTAAPKGAMQRLLRQPLAWQVTLYMGLQSALAYSVFSWLPSMLVSRGLGTVEAGLGLSWVILVSTPSSFLAPWLSAYWRDERVMNALMMVFYMLGMAGCWFAPMPQQWLWQAVLGVGLGGGFAMALTLLALRAPDSASATQLSAMAQGLGYVLAAVGPLGVGLLQDASGWPAAAYLLQGLALVSLLAGLGAGRQRYIQTN